MVCFLAKFLILLLTDFIASHRNQFWLIYNDKEFIIGQVLELSRGLENTFRDL